MHFSMHMFFYFPSDNFIMLRPESALKPNRNLPKKNKETKKQKKNPKGRSKSKNSFLLKLSIREMFIWYICNLLNFFYIYISEQL